METITGKTTAHTIMQNIEVAWAMDSEGTVTANGETAGRVVESLPGVVYAFPADGRNWEATFCSVANAAASLAALHVS
ncbi:hypothetical protein [Paenarthrobacter sp. NPDC090522]|uniref:hypothetical protein n=1 Tax=Paenarthrobacter sp. NPDC090522 TaxID=3364383 RepID=UPI0037F998EF